MSYTDSRIISFNNGQELQLEEPLLQNVKGFLLLFTPIYAIRFMGILTLNSLLFISIYHQNLYSNPSELGERISILYITGLFVYLLGNYEYTLRKWKDYLLFVPIMIASMFIFYWFGTQTYFHNNLSSRKDWSDVAKVIYPISLSLTALVLLYHLHYTFSHYRNLFSLYLKAMILPLLLIGSLYTYSNILSGSIIVHVHHWWLGYYVSFFTRYNTIISRISAAIFLGIAVEGIIDADNTRLFIIDKP